MTYNVSNDVEAIHVDDRNEGGEDFHPLSAKVWGIKDNDHVHAEFVSDEPNTARGGSEK
jgi:hypothetical protein